jgi:hypothetical protein
MVQKENKNATNICISNVEKSFVLVEITFFKSNFSEILPIKENIDINIYIKKKFRCGV